MAISLSATGSFGPAAALADSTSGQGMTFNSSLNIVSSIDTSSPGSPFSNSLYQGRPLVVYGQPTIIPNTTVSPAGYPGAGTAHYSLQSYSAFVPSPGPFPGGTGGIFGGHMKFMSNAGESGPTGYDAAANYVSSPTSSFGYTPQVAGSIINPYASGISYSSASDYRLKENITPIENGLDYIMPLRPRRFNWKDGGGDSLGFIAHEIQEDAPIEVSGNIVVGTKDASIKLGHLIKDGEVIKIGLEDLFPEPSEEALEKLNEDGMTWQFVKENIIPQSVGTKFLVAPLVASVQELKKIYDEQEIEIQELETRMIALKQRKQTQ
jgi:hypothetical protein